jgi:hypothetical protein
MVNFTKLTTRAAPSTPVDRIRERESREFRSRPTARQISQRTRVRTGSMSSVDGVKPCSSSPQSYG